MGVVGEAEWVGKMTDRYREALLGNNWGITRE